MTISRYARAAMTGMAAAVMALAVLVVPADATDGPHRAGLLVVHSGGRLSQRCVEFPEDTIDGLALLQRSGLDLNVDATNSVGVAVCRIDNEGCAFPEQECFCECLGATCIYWSYWRLAPGGDWQYANMGASSGIVSDGDVDAWVWGAGNGAASLLPPVSFDDICAPAAPTLTPTVTATPPPTVLWYPSDTPEPLPTNTAVASSTSTVAVTAATPDATAAMPSPTVVTPSAAGSPVTSLVISQPAPVSAAGPAVSFTPVPTMYRGTPVITTPTTFPAQVTEGPAATTPTHPAAATIPAQETATLTPAAVAQVIPMMAEPSSTPTFLLGGGQLVTSTPTPRRAADETSGRLPIPGMILAGVGACGAVALLLVRRSSP